MSHFRNKLRAGDFGTAENLEGENVITKSHCGDPPPTPLSCYRRNPGMLCNMSRAQLLRVLLRAFSEMDKMEADSTNQT